MNKCSGHLQVARWKRRLQIELRNREPCPFLGHRFPQSVRWQFGPACAVR